VSGESRRIYNFSRFSRHVTNVEEMKKEVERGRGEKKGSWKKRGQPKEEIKVVK
jgi:hypothetical protein